MTRSDDSADVRVRSDLAVVDRALAEGRATEDDPRRRSLEELALALRTETPAPRPAFVEELDRRAAAGFPPRRGALRLLETASTAEAAMGRTDSPAARSRRSRALRPALAVAASIVLVSIVAVPLLDREGGEAGMPADSPTQADPVRPQAGPSLRSGPPSVASNDETGPKSSTGAEPPLDSQGSGGVGRSTGGAFAPEQAERSIERSASLSLAAPEERLEAVADAIVRAVDRRRGLVLSSSVSAGAEGDSGGSFDLRVPSADLPELMRELSALGEVRARSQSAEDVTATRVSAGERLEEARAERRGLLRRLGQGGSTAEVASARTRLRLAGARVRGASAELRALRLRTDYATVAVSLSSEDASSAASTPLELGYSDFLEALVTALAFALRLLGVLIPLAAVTIPAVFVARAVRRRRRESVLG